MRYKITGYVISIFVISALVLNGCGGTDAGRDAGNTQESAIIAEEDAVYDAAKNRNYMRKSYVAAGIFSYAIREDGTVMQAGEHENISFRGGIQEMPDVSSWENMNYLSANGFSVCGVDKDGKLYGDGMDNDSGEGALSLYKDGGQIISDGLKTFTILKTSGELTYSGEKQSYMNGYSTVSDVKYITTGASSVAAIKGDGSVKVFGSNNKYGQLDIYQWEGIVDIACGLDHMVGLKADGTVVAAGDNTYGQCDVSGWTDIIQVTAGNWATIGLKADGTVVAAGRNKDGECDVSEWTDIVAVVCGGSHTLGIKSDGTAVAVGDNRYGQCEVSEWKNIKIPEMGER